MSEISAYKQAILDRREARKQATIERNLFKARLNGVVSHEQRRAEKAFAASIGLTWCGRCQEWKDTSVFWKGTKVCRHCLSKTEKSRAEINAESKQKAQERKNARDKERDKERAEKAQRKNARDKERAEKAQRKLDAAMDNLLKKYWWTTVKPLFFKLTKEQYKEQLRQRKREKHRRLAMEKSGCSTWEEHLRHLSHSKKKSPEERKEHRRIRNQWRNYRKQAKAGMGANGGRIPRGWIDKQKAEQGYQCALCWKPLPESFEIDHIIPVCFGGENVAENLQLVCPPCNVKKGNSLDANFAE